MTLLMFSSVDDYVDVHVAVAYRVSILENKSAVSKESVKKRHKFFWTDKEGFLFCCKIQSFNSESDSSESSKTTGYHGYSE